MEKLTNTQLHCCWLRNGERKKNSHTIIQGGWTVTRRKLDIVISFFALNKLLTIIRGLLKENENKLCHNSAHENRFEK